MISDSSHGGIPEKIGKYHVSRVLGRGSMGVVYLARDTLIDREVAIKTIVLPPGLDDDKIMEFRARFLREARAAGRLSHPAIVTIYEADDGAGGGPPFIAMEFVEGLPWNHKIRQHTFPEPEQVLSLAREIASALDYAHRTGVVHRDIKPANIVQTPDGHVKLMDFGIAKVPTSELTREGQFLGTPAYMSPEQIMGKAVDGRSDIFSLGTVLYELLTCQKPFPGEDITTVTYSILRQDPRPARSINPAIPEEVDRILFHLMAKDPDQRYASARQVVEDIDAFMASAALPHAGTSPDLWVETHGPAPLDTQSATAAPQPPLERTEPARVPAPVPPKAPPPQAQAPAAPAARAAATPPANVRTPPQPTVKAPPPAAPAPPPKSARPHEEPPTSLVAPANIEATVPGGSGLKMVWVLGGLLFLAVVAVGILVGAFFWFRSQSKPAVPDSDTTLTSVPLEPSSGPSEPAATQPAPAQVPSAAAEQPKPKPRPKPPAPVVKPPVAAPVLQAPKPPPPVVKPPELVSVSYTFTTGTKRGEFWIRIDGKDVSHQTMNRKGSIFGQETYSGTFQAYPGQHAMEFQIRTEIQNLNERHSETVTLDAGKKHSVKIVMTKFNKEIRFEWGG